MNLSKPTIRVDFMTRRDLEHVLSIESQFEFPWTEDDFVKTLRHRNHIGMVAVIDGRIVGFMVYALHSKRLHVLNFAVREDCHRQGVGTAMIQRLVRKLGQHESDRKRILLEVRETNLDAQLFFRSLGFRAVAVLEKFYDDSTEDAYLMEYRYVAGAETPAGIVAQGASANG